MTTPRVTECPITREGCRCLRACGPALPTSTELVRHRLTALTDYSGPFVMRDGRRCVPSIPSVHPARYSSPVHPCR